VRSASQSEAIVDRDTFGRVQALLNKQTPTMAVYQLNRANFPLRKFVRCGCDTVLTGSTAKKTYNYYHCRMGCSGSTIRTEALEREFVALLDRLAVRPNCAAAFSDVLRDLWSQKKAEARAVAAALTQRIAKIDETQQRLLKKFVESDVIPQEMFRQENERLIAEKNQAERELASLQSEELDVDAVLRFGEALIVDPSRAWRSAGIEHKQRLQKLYFPAGLQFSAGKFGTPVTGLFFNHFAAHAAERSRLVAHTGFEPVLPP
jgi:predicted transcriptional regulator